MVPLIDLLWPMLLATGAALLVSGVLGMLLPCRAEVAVAGIHGLVLPPADAVPVAPSRVLSQWEGYVAYHLAVNIMVAYLAGLALLPGTDFSPVFRFAATVAFLGYGFTSLHAWLWHRRPWRTIWPSACKGVVCSLASGGTIASLWPAA